MAVGNEIRVGVIGVGSIAQIAHLPQLKALGVPIISVADIVEERAKRIAQQYDVPYSYRDYKKLLKRDDINAVIVAVPTKLHYPIVIDALKAGKHVFCEKPPAIYAWQAEKMAELSDKTGLVLMYGLQLRYRKDSQAFWQLIKKGKLGKVYYGRTIYLRRRGAPGGWFARKNQSGGGPLVDIGVHFIDLTWWLMGKPKPISASGFWLKKIGAKGVKLNKGWQPADVKEGLERKVFYDVEDFFGGFIRFENETVLLFEVSWQINIKTDQWGSLICGTKAGASMPPLELYTEQFGNETVVNLNVGEGNAYQEEMKEFITCVRENIQPLTNALDGVTVMKMLTALIKSAEKTKEIAIN